MSDGEEVSAFDAVTRTRKLHSPIKARYQRTHDGGPEDLCLECGASWPCATYDALDIALDRLQELSEQRGFSRGFDAGWAQGIKTEELLNSKLRDALEIIERVRKYADERSVYAKTKNNTVGSWRIASDLHEIVGEK